MDFMTAVKTCFSKYIDWNGRASRSEFWFWILFVFIASVVLSLADSMIGAGEIGLLAPLFSLATFLPGIFVTVRRLHDTDHSGWWYLIVFTGIGALLILYWVIIKGNDGENRFGADPV